MWPWQRKREPEGERQTSLFSTDQFSEGRWAVLRGLDSPKANENISSKTEMLSAQMSTFKGHPGDLWAGKQAGRKQRVQLGKFAVLWNKVLVTWSRVVVVVVVIEKYIDLR